MPVKDERAARDAIEKIDEQIQVIAIELNHRIREFDPNDKSLAVTTFVDLDNLSESSSFGRFLGEQLSTELHKLGFNIRELRQRKTIAILRDKGEFALTREASELMKKFQVDAVLAGTYMLVGDEVVVNARVIDVDSSRVISVGQMITSLRGLDQIRALLSRRSRGSTPIVKVVNPEKS